MKLQDIKVKKKKVKPTPEAINPALSFESIKVSESIAQDPIADKVAAGWNEFKQNAETLKPIPQRVNENLRNWFKEKWVRFGPDGKIRGECGGRSQGEGKPKCLPASKAHSLGKKGRASAAARKRREDPNPERSGAAINVATKKKTKEAQEYCPECGGSMYPETMINEKKDACYYKVKSRYKVWPSAYASGALVRCRKKGAKNWGSKSKNESVDESQLDEKWSEKYKRSINCDNPRGFSQRAHCQGRKKNEDQQLDEKCWDGYKQQGMKKKGNRMVPNCVPTESVEEDAIDDRLTAQYNTPAMKAQSQAVDKAFASGDQAEFDRLGIMSPQQIDRDYQAMLAKEPAQDAAVYTNPNLTPSARKLPVQKYNPKGVPVKEGAPNFKSKQEVINYFVSKGKSAASGAAAWERGWRGPKQQKSFKSTKSLPKQHYWWQDRDLDEAKVTQDPTTGKYAVSGAKDWSPIKPSKANIPAALWDLAKQGMGIKKRYNTDTIATDPRSKRNISRHGPKDWVVVDPYQQVVSKYTPGTRWHNELETHSQKLPVDFNVAPGLPLPTSFVGKYNIPIHDLVAIPGSLANARGIYEAAAVHIKEDEEYPFIVYVNGKPVGKFDTPEEAKRMALQIYSKMKSAYIDIRRTKCTDEIIQTISENENLYI